MDTRPTDVQKAEQQERRSFLSAAVEEVKEAALDGVAYFAGCLFRLLSLTLSLVLGMALILGPLLLLIPTPPAKPKDAPVCCAGCCACPCHRK